MFRYNESLPSEHALRASGFEALDRVVHDHLDDEHWSRHHMDTSFSGWRQHALVLHKEELYWGVAPRPLDNVPESKWRNDPEHPLYGLYANK